MDPLQCQGVCVSFKSHYYEQLVCAVLVLKIQSLV